MQLIYYPHECNTTDVRATPHMSTADLRCAYGHFVFVFLTDTFVNGSFIGLRISALKGNYDHTKMKLFMTMLNVNGGWCGHSITERLCYASTIRFFRFTIRSVCMFYFGGPGGSRLFTCFLAEKFPRFYFQDQIKLHRNALDFTKKRYSDLFCF